MELFLKTTIDPARDIIFFDEIQECPEALTSLKYFQEENQEQAVCCAGSYLGLLGSDSSFPVGKVTTLHLYPLDYLEFLRAWHPELAAHLDSFLEKPSPLPKLVHQQLWEVLLIFFVAGGMPEVVAAILDARTLDEKVRMRIADLHKDLLIGYKSDFAKHAGKANAQRVNSVFDQVPFQLSKNIDGTAQRFRFKDVLPRATRYRDLHGAISWLTNTGLIYPCHLLEHALLPLNAYKKENLVKLYLFDIGLLHHTLGLNAAEVLLQSYGTYKGYVAENYTATQLTSSGAESLFTWKGGVSEIEFLLQIDNSIIPVEVKSGFRTKRSKSLNAFIEKYNPPLAVKVSGRNFSFQDRTLHIPLYAAGKIPEIIKRLA